MLQITDNVVLEEFLEAMSQTQTTTPQLKIDMNQFDPYFRQKLPYVFDGPTLRRLGPNESTVNGFWTKVNIKGSTLPVSRENPTLMPMLEDGQLVIYSLGGSPYNTGQFNFEIYKIYPSTKQWEKVEYSRPIVQTLGSRPVYKVD